MAFSRGQIEAGSAFVRLYSEDDDFAAAMRKNENRVLRFGETVAKVGRQMMTAGLLMAAAMAVPTRVFAQYSDQMQVVRAVTQATERQFAALDAQAKELGRTTSFTARQVAEGMTSLGRAGFDPTQIQQSIRPILDLARATDTELGGAAEIAAATLRGFRMEVDQTGRVADVLTVTANASAQTLTDLGEAMKYVAPTAAEANESLESMSLALGVLANMGIKGTMAGTALRNMLLQLAKPDVQKQLHAMGIEAVDADKNLRPLGQIMAELGEKLQEMGSAKRMNLAEVLFGRRAIGAALKLGGSPEQVAKLQQAIMEAYGASGEIAGKMESALGGTLRRIISAIEGVAIAFGQSLAPTLQSWEKMLTNAAAAATRFLAENRWLVSILAHVAAGLITAGAAMLAYGSAIKILVFGFGALKMAVNGFLIALNLILAHPVLATLAVLGYLLHRASYHTAELTDKMTKLREAGDEQRRSDRALLSQLEQLAGKTRLNNDEQEQAKTIIASLEEQYGKLGISVDATTGQLIGFAAAQEKVNQAMRAKAIADVRAEILEMAKNQRELGKEMQTMGLLGKMFFGLGEKDRLARLNSEYESLDAEIKRAFGRWERLKAGLGGGDLTGEGPSSGLGVPDESEANAALEYNAKMAEKIHQLRLESIQDEHERALAMIESRYATEIEKARETGAAVALVEEAKRLEIEKTNEEFERRAELERQARQEQIDAQNESLQNQIQRLEIEQSDKSDAWKKGRLLALERDQALERARKEGLDVDLVNKLFDLKGQAIKMPEMARKIQTFGGFSGGGAAGLRGLLGAQPVEEKIADFTEATAKNTNLIAKAMRRGMVPAVT